MSLFNQNCRLSSSLLLIRFSDSTCLDELNEQFIPIPDVSFFVQIHQFFPPFLNLTNE